MPDNDLVRLDCPQCNQRIALPRDNPAVEIGCPKCDVGSRLERSENGEIAQANLLSPTDNRPSRGSTLLNRFRPQKRHAGLLFALLVFLGIYFLGVPFLMFRWALKKAEKGDVAAQMEVALHYETGDGPWRSYPDAVHWYVRASSQGHHGAMHLLFGGLQFKRSGNPARVNVAQEMAALTDAQAFAIVLNRRPIADVQKWVEFDPIARRILEDLADRGSSLARLRVARVLYDHFGFDDEVKKHFEKAMRSGLDDCLSRKEFEHAGPDTQRALRQFRSSWHKINRRIEGQKGND